MILSGITLYGTVFNGGSSYSGTLFAVNTNGKGFTNLYIFTGVSGGSSPNAVMLSSNILYGTATHGGSAGNGTVFAVNTDGTGFTNLYSFTALTSSTNSDGANPKAGLILSGNTLYGTTVNGGANRSGTVFALNLNSSASTPLTPIPLTIQSAGNAVVLSWTNSAFNLQSAPAVTGTYISIPGATTPYTNHISGAQQFFRLEQ